MKADKVQKVSGIIPEHVHHTRIDTYEKYRNLIDIIVGDIGYNLSFIIGKKGNGKTSAFERILEQYDIEVQKSLGESESDEEGSEESEPETAKKRWHSNEPLSGAPIAYLNNAASAVGLYEWAFDNKDKKVLIIDDVRKLFKDEDAVTLLMQLCNTKPTKQLHWRKHNKRFENEGIPSHFRTNSRMVIISNTIDGMVERLEPLLDRGRTFHFDPSTEELHHNWAKSWADPVVWQYIDEHLDECPSPSGRWYYHAAEEKRVNPLGWKKHLLDLWRSTDPERGTFIEVQNDQTLTTEAQRIEAFRRLGQERQLPASRATYFRWKEDFPHLVKPLPKKVDPQVESLPTLDNRADQVEIERVDSAEAIIEVDSTSPSLPKVAKRKQKPRKPKKHGQVFTESERGSS